MEFGGRKCRQERKMAQNFKKLREKIGTVSVFMTVKRKPEVFAGNLWYPVVLRGPPKVDSEFSPAIAGRRT